MDYTTHPAEHISHSVDKAAFLRQLQQQLKPENILSAPEQLRAYDCDALSIYQVLPWLVFCTALSPYQKNLAYPLPMFSMQGMVIYIH